MTTKSRSPSHAMASPMQHVAMAPTKTANGIGPLAQRQQFGASATPTATKIVARLKGATRDALGTRTAEKLKTSPLRSMAWTRK